MLNCLNSATAILCCFTGHKLFEKISSPAKKRKRGEDPAEFRRRDLQDFGRATAEALSGKRCGTSVQWRRRYSLKCLQSIHSLSLICWRHVYSLMLFFFFFFLKGSDASIHLATSCHTSNMASSKQMEEPQKKPSGNLGEHMVGLRMK